MHDFDHALTGLADGGVVMAGIVAVLLGLRHATDPDHLTAMATLVLSDARQRMRRASLLGLAWGAGHAITFVAFGLPVVLVQRSLPDGVRRAAEFAVGAIIIGLALRLLIRWRHGHFHSHPHSHGAVRHAHPHAHEAHHASAPERPEVHRHEHADSLGRSPLGAFGIGLVHGAGGSAAVGALLVGAMPGSTEAVVSLFVFAGATALSMAGVSALCCAALTRGVGWSPNRVVPGFAVLSMAFGVWYALAAFGG